MFYFVWKYLICPRRELDVGSQEVKCSSGTGQETSLSIALNGSLQVLLVMWCPEAFSYGLYVSGQED